VPGSGIEEELRCWVLLAGWARGRLGETRDGARERGHDVDEKRGVYDCCRGRVLGLKARWSMQRGQIMAEVEREEELGGFSR
jgi:hypothetical protein